MYKNNLRLISYLASIISFIPLGYVYFIKTGNQISCSFAIEVAIFYTCVFVVITVISCVCRRIMYYPYGMLVLSIIVFVAYANITFHRGDAMCRIVMPDERSRSDFYNI